MSEMCMYELEDIIWKDLYQSDDHIGIHPGDEQANQQSFGCNNRKRPRHESILEGGSGDSSSERHTVQDRAKQIKHIVHPKCQMLGKQSANKAIHFCNSHLINEASPLESDGIKISDDSCMDTLLLGNELPDKESIESEKTVTVSGSVGYQHIFAEADNILDCFGHNGGKDSSDFSGYSWDNLGNFEDVDRMFRSCNSTFGHGTRQEDDLSWLSSSDAIEKSGDLFNSDFNFSCLDSNSQKSMSESEDRSRSNGVTSSLSESKAHNSLSIFKGYCQHGILSFFKGTSESCGPVNKDKIMQMKLPNQREKHKNHQNVGHTAFSYAAEIPETTLRPIEAPDSHSGGYMHSDTTFIKSDYSFSSEENLLHPAQSEIKSENSSPVSVSPKDSQTSLLQVVSFEENEKGELMNRPQNIHSSWKGISKNMDFGSQASENAIISNGMAVHYSRKTGSDGVNVGIHRESGSSVAQNSSVSSGMDDISIDATSFHYLQLVMEQLDLRTKLCIRGSLYRLARSAGQRHQYVEFNGRPISDRESMLSEGSTKFLDFMDMETDTNPIDRSIAHLLFHRPVDSAVLSGRTYTKSGKF